MHQQPFLDLHIGPKNDTARSNDLHLLGVGVGGLYVQSEAQLLGVGKHLCEDELVEVGLEQLDLRL